MDIDCVRYPLDGVSIDYASHDYVDQYKDLKIFYKEYLGEQLLNAFTNYADMKNEDPIQVIELRFQFDHANSKKNQLFQEYRGLTNNARLFMIMIRHREIERISNGKKITEVNIIEKVTTNFKRFNANR